MKRCFFLIILLSFSLINSTLAKKKSKELILSEQEIKDATIYYSIEDALANKKKAYVLNLDNQKLDDLPEAIIKLKNLQSLSIKYNNFSELPSDIFQL